MRKNDRRTEVVKINMLIVLAIPTIRILSFAETGVEGGGEDGDTSAPWVAANEHDLALRAEGRIRKNFEGATPG